MTLLTVLVILIPSTGILGQASHHICKDSSILECGNCKTYKLEQPDRNNYSFTCTYCKEPSVLRASPSATDGSHIRPSISINLAPACAFTPTSATGRMLADSTTSQQGETAKESQGSQVSVSVTVSIVVGSISSVAACLCCVGCCICKKTQNGNARREPEMRAAPMRGVHVEIEQIEVFAIVIQS